MITRIRLLVLLARPSLVLIFCLFGAVGVAQGGAPQDAARLLGCLLPVMGFILFSVVVNDLSDRAIDRVNLPGDRRRPLVAGMATDRDFVVVAVVGAAVAVVGALRLGGLAPVVAIAGLTLSAGYSLRPVRIADRGAVAALLLPAGYVAVPYLLGLLSVRHSLTGSDAFLGAGLYLGFIGRILLKDFRDVRGDALFGKRTFLVRHGRRWTCAFSAACWVAGAMTLAAVRQPTGALAIAYAVQVVLALMLLFALSDDRGARRDEWLISAIAIVGRGLVLTLLAHFSMTDARWSSTSSAVLLASLTAIVAVQALTMATLGPFSSARFTPEAFVSGVATAPSGSRRRAPVTLSQIG